MEPSKIRILVVEDDIGTARLLGDLLVLEGYAVDAAGTAKEALEKMACAPPGLILLDINLPDVNGLELLARLRRSGDQVRVVMMSTLSDRSYRNQAMKLGAQAFLGKPFTPTTLVETVRKALGPAPPRAG